jgi:Flp pilus assembly protein TadD
MDMPTPADLFTRAVQLHKQGALREAEHLYRQVLAAEPSNAAALNFLGMLACQLGDLNAAGEFFRRAIHFRPQEYGFYNNLGLVYEGLGRPTDAVSCYQQALKLAPNTPEVLVGLGNALHALGRTDEAEAHLRQAIALRPGYAQAHNNLGSLRTWQGRPAEAMASLQEALRLQPNYVEAHNNLGYAFKELGRLDEAEAEFNEALRLAPEFADAHWNRAILWLLRGDTERGWPEYEWRWPAQGLAPREFTQPRWDGSPLEGRTILLHAEQGLGDTIQFIRFAPLVAERGGRVVVECQPPLARLLATAAGIDQVVPRGESLPAFDVHAPLLSVPGLLQTTLGTIPSGVPYLQVDPGLVQHWRRELESFEGRKIGIAWQGNPAFRGDRQRSVPLSQFAPLAAVPGVQLISLQVGPALEQIRGVANQSQVHDLTPRRRPDVDGFQDTAAIMMNLDLVTSTDTSVPHLAGALGVPVWLALAHAADWRWLLDRGDSPWYPTMRLFRQDKPGDWPALFTAMAEELRRTAS